MYASQRAQQDGSLHNDVDATPAPAAATDRPYQGMGAEQLGPPSRGWLAQAEDFVDEVCVPAQGPIAPAARATCIRKVRARRLLGDLR